MRKQAPVLESRRLILSEIRESDTKSIVSWRSNPDVYQYFKFPHKISYEEHIKWFYERYLVDNNRVDFICKIKSTDMAIGIFSIRRESDKSQTVEISYLLDTKAQHKGYAKEGVERIIEWAKLNWKSRNVEAIIHRDNQASIAFIEKNGYSCEAEDGDFLLYRKHIIARASEGV